MGGTLQFFNSFRKDPLIGTFDLDAAVDGSLDTLYIALVGAGWTPAATMATWTSVTNEVTATGYTAGGQKLAGGSLDQTNPSECAVKFSEASWAITGSGLTAKYGVIYKNSGTKPLVGYFTLNQDGTNLTVPSGNTLRITFGSAAWKYV